MKKIPTLFIREFSNHRVVKCTQEVLPGLEYILEGKATPTVKYDGTCCAIINGNFYKRYDAKQGKTPPAGAIPCCPPDPVTDHWPHWVPVYQENPDDQYLAEAFYNSLHTVRMLGFELSDGTYECVGPKIQGNPYNAYSHILIKHGTLTIPNLVTTYDGIKEWLENNNEEGIVFWYNGEPVCKIKRTDFGLPWPMKEGAK